MSTSRVLFDEPGPIARRRIRVATVVVSIAVAGLIALAVRRFADHGQLDADKWRPYTTWPMWRYLLQGVRATVEAAAVATGLSLAGGIVLALGRLSPHRRFRWPAVVYIEVMRTVPVLLLVYIVLFGLPHYGVNLPLFWKLVAPLSVSSAAVFAEIFRAGILSLDRGQREAGLAIGMTRRQTMWIVVLPQAVRRLLPSLVSQSVGLLKDTSLGFIVSYSELLYSGRILATYNRLLIQTYIVIALVYIVINASLSKFARTLEARQGVRPAGRRRLLGFVRPRPYVAGSPHLRARPEHPAPQSEGPEPQNKIPA
ncbi:amino acid ABC transporter permease [Yinghuangia seranimata]|uniref:amino acid ABC transporter permease n=1 Tax=Yinghuangia seranimata TaxID=408067 RepID=UPI00248BDF65|nr:amino acid ABC transporter permease [Yinghuangia seranimata]MDI2128981.1 amino acid ABC transporter permease [Yinghuangia seranimata]